MSTRAKGIRKHTIDRLWADAQRSVNLILSPALITLLDLRIKHLWQTYLGHEQCLIQIKEQMARIYQGLGEAGEALPPIIKGFVSQINLARIIGETGPLTDFNHQRQMKRFGGLNIRERKSGKYRGKNKMSKKGRSRLRLILNQSIFHLIKKDRIFGEYYHSKKERGMVGTKAMAVVSKKLVDILFALSKPGTIFDIERLFVCESKYKNVA
jgi:transposase